MYSSEKRDSNPRPQPWQGCALPTELFSRWATVFSRLRCKGRHYFLAGKTFGRKISKKFIFSNFRHFSCIYKICCLPLQPQRAKDGSLAQLNRASDYGSEGYRFESCRSHRFYEIESFYRLLSSTE